MNIIKVIKEEFASYIASKLNVEPALVLSNIEYPSKENLGDLAIPISSIRKDRAQEISKELEGYRGKYIKTTKAQGIFLNAFIDEKQLFVDLFSSLNDNYGLEKTPKPLRYLVEHTSANPIHELHVGHLRNAILGDTIARLLKARGHQVITRFYVNDAGRQVATLIYGLEKLGFPDPPHGEKVDHWLGNIYAITNVLIEIRNLQEEAEKAKEDPQKYREIISKLDELVIISNELRSKSEKEFDMLADKIRDSKEAEARISEIIRLYENNDKELSEIVRRYVNLALEGFKESLRKLDIEYDGFDYESDLLWNGYVSEVVKLILSSPYRENYKGTIAINISDNIDDSVREKLRIPKGLDIPPLVVIRADSTTLYTTRDIAYTIYKFRNFNVDYVINVIAEEQTIPQIQLRAALYLLGFKEYGINLIHYSYAMVNVQGIRMSSRLGRLVSLDEIFERVKSVAISKIKEKGGVLENADEIVNSALRYAILSASASKQISFDINRIVDLNQNSGPYLQYTYARAYNILAKSTDKLDVNEANTDDIVDEKRKLLILIAKFPEVFEYTSDNLSPETLITYLKSLADTFNRWYDKERILQEPDKGKRIVRLFIVKGVERVLYNSLNVLGIKPITRM